MTNESVNFESKKSQAYTDLRSKNGMKEKSKEASLSLRAILGGIKGVD
jgi:hypothetical protein